MRINVKKTFAGTAQTGLRLNYPFMDIRRFSFLLTVVMFFVMLSSSVYGAVIYVAVDGDGDGTSWASPFGAVGVAITSSTDGDEIWIAEGTYYTTYLYLASTTISLYGGFAGTETSVSERDLSAHETIFDGRDTYTNRTLSISNSSIVDGITFTNGISSSGAAISISSSSPVIRHCKFYNNTSTGTTASLGYIGGGAVSLNRASAVFSDCIFAENSADAVGGYGGAVHISSTGVSTFTNCTFTRNSAKKGGAVFNNGSENQRFYNCIISGNTATDPGYFNGGQGYNGGTLSGGSHNCCPDYGFGSSQQYGDPQLVDPDNGNFHIAPGSPCIDTGTISVSLSAFDMDGDNRLLDGDSNGSAVVDIGADEYDPSKSYYADMYVDGTAGNDTNVGNSWATAKQTIQAAVVAAGSGSEIWVRMGTYQLVSEINIDKQLFLYGGFVGTEIQRISRDWQLNPTIIDGQDSVRCVHLTTNADGGRLDGFSVINGNSVNGAGIFVSAPDAIIINCIIDSNSSPGVAGGVYFSANATIQECQISNNEAVSSGGGIYNGFVSSTINSCLIEGNRAASGGGIFNDGGFAPIITNSIIKDNYASDKGGGICNDEKNDAVISNCEILSNIATARGGGIYSGQGSSSNTTNAEVKLTNNVIANNWATWGGGLYNAERSMPDIINCTIAGNTAATSGAGLYVYNQYSYTSVMNTVFFGNVLDGGGHSDIYFNGSVPQNLRLINNSFSMLDESWHNTGTDRVDNIAVDVKFIDYDGPDSDPLTGGDSNYNLTEHSGVIDQGRASYYSFNIYHTLTAPSSDIEGISRAQGSAFDMGAYEAIISTYSLTMASSPVAGGTTLPVTGVSQVLPATAQDISATPESGYNFTSWTSDISAVVANPDAATTTVTLTGHATVTANFCLVQSWYEDSDEDGYGDPASMLINSCTQPVGYVSNNTDCDDLDLNEHPGQTWYQDQDGDGYSNGTSDISSCERPTDYYVASELTAVLGDCNDNDASINPGVAEIPDDTIDQNCDGFDTITCIFDGDHDGYGVIVGTTVLAEDGSCDANDGESVSSDDCNDSDGSVNPGVAEIPDDTIDQNCSGSDTITCTVDADHDGYGTIAGTTILAQDGSCDTAEGESSTSDDCDDTNAQKYPGQIWYQDSDNDNYGNPAVTLSQCEQPVGYVSNNTDCDDMDINEYPGQTWYKDQDQDMYSDGTVLNSCERPMGYYLSSDLVASSGDCDDLDVNEYPGQVWYEDLDSDGYSNGTSTSSCERPVSYYLDSELTATSGDNCPTVSNSDQADDNHDGTGNVCEDNEDDGIATPVDGYMNETVFVDESSLFSSNFTDIHSGGVTSGSINDRADLAFSVGDSAIGGVSISASGGAGDAMINLCDFNMKMTSGDYCVATCGSLILDVVSGPIEVYLGKGDYVSIPGSVTTTIAETTKGTFFVGNTSGTESLFVFAGGKKTAVNPGESIVVKNSFSWNLFLPAIIGRSQQ